MTRKASEAPKAWCNISFRVSPELYAELAAAATQNERTLSGECLYRLKRSLEGEKETPDGQN